MRSRWTRGDPQYEGVDEFYMLGFYSGARTELSHRHFLHLVAGLIFGIDPLIR